MGIAGSIVDHNFFESWLGMKVQAVDMTELRRRIDQKIYDETELEMALAWADKHFRYGEDQNAEQYKRNETQSRAVLKESLLMAMCIRDMMQGNRSWRKKGWWRSRWATTPSPPVSTAPLDRSIPQWRYRRSAAQQLL
jgi:L-fucose isomerase